MLKTILLRFVLPVLLLAAGATLGGGRHSSIGS